MSNRLHLDGMDAFRRDLRELPEDLAREGDGVVRGHADEAQRLIQAAYPTGPTGNLKRGVRTDHQVSKFGTQSIVRSRAKHASIFEHGSATRRTGQGANRGVMPAATVDRAMLPIVIRIRKRMVDSLVALVQRAGFVVTR